MFCFYFIVYLNKSNKEIMIFKIGIVLIKVILINIVVFNWLDIFGWWVIDLIVFEIICLLLIVVLIVELKIVIVVVIKFNFFIV